MTTAEIEHRLTAIEQELTLLKARVPDPSTPSNRWIEKIAGTFSDTAARDAFDEAMRFGRQWRKAQRPKSRKRRRSAKK